MSKKFWQKVRLNEVLTRLMKEANMNASKLSRNTGLAITTVKRLCSDDCNPTLKSLEPIANYFDISINQLLGAEPLPQDKGQGMNIPNVMSWGLVPVITMDESVRWPQNKEEIQQRFNLEYVAVDAEPNETLFAMRLQGNSMEPRFSADTILVLDPQMKPHDGSVGLILHKGKSTPQYKEILMDGPDMYIRSINPELPGSKLEPYNEEQFQLLGVLRHIRKDFN